MNALLSRITPVFLLLLLGFVFTPSGSVFAYDEQNPMVLKVGIDNPPQDMKAVTIKRLGDEIEKRTNGRVTFKYFYGGSLIKKPQFVDGVARGIADISTGPISFVTGKIPELSPFEVYGAYQLDKFLEMQEAVEPAMVELMEQKGVRHLMIQYTGSTIFPHKSKFLKTPEDWQGQKMRLGGRWQSELGKLWGASPVFMPPSELYLAQQRGVIDGYMLIWDIVNGLKLYEVSPYIMDSGFSNNIEIVTMNLKKWNELTAADQAVFNEVLDAVKPWNYEETLKSSEQMVAGIIAKGAKVHYLTADEKSRYLKDAVALYPEVEKIAGPFGTRLIKLLAPFRDE